MKFLLFSALLFLSTFSLEAQWNGPGCWSCGCRKYADPTLAGYEGLSYGYVDNINYPEPYALPLNRCFNYRPPCPLNSYNHRYLENCIHYTNRKNSS